MSRIPVIAIAPHTYHGRPVATGEQYEVTPVEAAALKYQRKVMFAADAPSNGDDPEPRSRRRYRRRDLVPEL